MIKRLLLGTIVLGLAGLSNLSADPVTLDFSSIIGASISFSGNSLGQFGFTNTGTNSFEILNDNVGNTTGTEGDFGNLGPNSNTTFTIGAITTSGSTETAIVTGTGSFSLNDGGGTALSDYLTGAVSFASISQTGTGGSLNDTGTIDLTGLSYTGTNAALKSLAAASNSGILSVSYTFIPAVALTVLKAGTAAHITTYSGVLTAAPEPSLSGLALLGFGVLLMAMWRRFQASKA